MSQGLVTDESASAPVSDFRMSEVVVEISLTARIDTESLAWFFGSLSDAPDSGAMMNVSRFWRSMGLGIVALVMTAPTAPP